MRNTKNAAGSGVKPSSVAKGVNGSKMPNNTITTTVVSSAKLGLLRNGLPAVRMTRSTRVCVARDSTNQPVWKKTSDARKSCEQLLDFPTESVGLEALKFSKRPEGPK